MHSTKVCCKTFLAPAWLVPKDRLAGRTWATDVRCDLPSGLSGQAMREAARLGPDWTTTELLHTVPKPKHGEGSGTMAMNAPAPKVMHPIS